MRILPDTSVVHWLVNAVYSVVHSKAELAVAIYLCRRRVISGKHKTFDVPNGELKSWGISRKVKYRALEWLADAGLIKLDRNGRGALTVTILSQLKALGNERCIFWAMALAQCHGMALAQCHGMALVRAMGGWP